MADKSPNDEPLPAEDPPKDDGDQGHAGTGSADGPPFTSIEDGSLTFGTTPSDDIDPASPSDISNSKDAGSIFTQGSKLQESTAAPDGTLNTENGADLEINGTTPEAGSDSPPFGSASIVKRLRQNLSIVGGTSSRLDERGGLEYREKKDLERRIAELEVKNEELKNDKQRLDSLVSFLEQAVEDANTELEKLNDLLLRQMHRS